MDSVFFSTQNYRKIYNIIENDIKKSYNISIAATPTYKKKIIDTMKYVYNNRGQFEIPVNMSSIDKSRYLSQKTIKIFMLYENDTQITPTKNHNEFKNKINTDTNTNTNTNTNTFDSRIMNSFPTNNNTLNRELQSTDVPVNQLQLSERPNTVFKQDNRKQIELNLKRSLIEHVDTIKKPVDINFRDEALTKFDDVNVDNKYMELAEMRKLEYEPANKETNDFSELTGTGNYANVREPNNRNTFLEQPEFKIKNKSPTNAIQKKLKLIPKPLNTDELIDNLQEIEPDNTIPDEFIKTEVPNKIITNNGVFETEGMEDFPGFDPQSDLLMTPLYNNNSNVSMDDLINEQVGVDNSGIITDDRAMDNLEAADSNTSHSHINEVVATGQGLGDVARNDMQNDKIDRIASLLEAFIESNNKMEAIETNINQMFYALKDGDGYKTETHTLHLRVDPIIDYKYNNCSKGSGCKDDCDGKKCSPPTSSEIKSCFWTGSKVRVKFPLIKNIISIKLKRVIAPGSNSGCQDENSILKDTEAECNSAQDELCDCGSGAGDHFWNAPFYYLMIDELKSDIIQGHSVFGDNSLVLEETPFCRMYFDEWWGKENPKCPTHLYFSNDGGDKTVFKTPKATLDSMTLSIKKPGKDCELPNIPTCGPTYLFFEVITVANYSGWNTIEPTI